MLFLTDVFVVSQVCLLFAWTWLHCVPLWSLIGSLPFLVSFHCPSRSSEVTLWCLVKPMQWVWFNGYPETQHRYLPAHFSKYLLPNLSFPTKTSCACPLLSDCLALCHIVLQTSPKLLPVIFFSILRKFVYYLHYTQRISIIPNNTYKTRTSPIEGTSGPSSVLPLFSEYPSHGYAPVTAEVSCLSENYWWRQINGVGQS